MAFNEQSCENVWLKTLNPVHLRVGFEPAGYKSLSTGRDFLLVRAEEGKFSLLSPRRTDQIDYPDAGLISGEGTVRYPGPCRVTSIQLPKEPLSAAVPELEKNSIQRISASASLDLIFGYVDLLRQEGAPDNAVMERRIADHIIDLAACVLRPAKEGAIKAASALRQTRLSAIRADIIANLSKVRLSARTLARRHDVSDRYVHLLFKETGETFGQFVMEERLKLALKLLTDPSRAAMRIGDIAMEVGFGELSTFNRAFRRRFGETPSAVRCSQRLR
jgi:AraC-like DNA-binding protein